MLKARKIGENSWKRKKKLLGDWVKFQVEALAFKRKLKISSSKTGREWRNKMDFKEMIIMEVKIDLVQIILNFLGRSGGEFIFSQELENELLYNRTLTIFDISSKNKEAAALWHRRSIRRQCSFQQGTPFSERVRRSYELRGIPNCLHPTTSVIL